VFCTVFNDYTDRGLTAEATEIAGIPMVDAGSRPSVRSFFESWGDRTCVINGLQVRSVAHDVCTRIAMCGSSRGVEDDWASVIAGNSDPSLAMPNVHVSGPLFPVRYGSASVRVGLAGQLPALLTGDALLVATDPIAPPDAQVEALEEAFLQARVETWVASAESGREAMIAADSSLALQRGRTLTGVAGELQVAEVTDITTQGSSVVECFRRGLSRVGVIAYGWGGNGAWDTHISNTFQDAMFEELFAGLDAVLTELADTPGDSEATMLDETTLCVLSEMGRVPTENAGGGKDHWTWTSAMLLGSGVRGGQAIGGWTEEITGEPMDLATGEVSSGGTTLLPGHIGATLLALADLDPGEFVDADAGEVIEAALE
jgi:uncharacterized protein (DUF1501 family)